MIPKSIGSFEKLTASPTGMAVGVGDLVDRVAERAGLHLDHRERLAVVEVEVVAVLQERALDRDRALVVEARAEAQVAARCRRR